MAFPEKRTGLYKTLANLAGLLKFEIHFRQKLLHRSFEFASWTLSCIGVECCSDARDALTVPLHPKQNLSLGVVAIQP